MSAERPSPQADGAFGPRAGNSRSQDAWIALAVAACLAFIYLLFYSGVSHNPDEWFYLQEAGAVLRGGLTAVAAHGWLYSLVLAPFYALSMAVPHVGALQAGLLSNALIIPLTAGSLYACLGELDGSRPARLATALIYGLATIAWPQSHYLLREPLAALCVLLAAWAAIRFYGRPSLAALAGFGLAMVCAVATKSVTLALLPFLGTLIVLPLARRLGERWESRRPAVQAGRLAPARLWTAGVLAVLLLATALSWRSPLMHRFVPTYIHYLQRGGPNLANFAALWISPGWGILAFSPALLIGLAGAPSLVRRYPPVAFAVLGGSLAFTLAASPHPFWWGNWGFGPRQVVPLLPLLCVALPQGLDWLRRRGPLAMLGGAVLIAFSVAFQLVGLAAPYGDYVRQVLFPAGVKGPDVAWDLRRYPIAELLRFVKPANMDLAWVAGRATESPWLRWEIAGPLALAALVAGAWLAYLVGEGASRVPAPWPLKRRSLLPTAKAAVSRAPQAEGGPAMQDPGSRALRARGAMGGVTLLIALAWLPVAFWALRSAYVDERYQPELGYAAAAELVRAEGRSGDLLVTDQWTDNLSGPVVAFLNYCRGGCPPRLDLIREDLTDRKKDWETTYLAALTGHQRAWLALERVPDGDPTSIVERWLGRVGYRERCQWTGPQVRVCLYSLEPGVTVNALLPAARFGDAIVLSEARVRVGQPGVPGRNDRTAVGPGSTLQVELKWEAQAAIQRDFVVSVQLLAADGRLVASTDAPPGGAFRPTTSWAPGDAVDDRYAVEVPADAPPGPYQLITLLYDPQDGRRLPVVERDGTSLMDYLRLLP